MMVASYDKTYHMAVTMTKNTITYDMVLDKYIIIYIYEIIHVNMIP